MIRFVLLALLALAAAAGASAQDGRCVPVGQWVTPGSRTPVAAGDVIARAARRQVVLLGERHDSAEDHRWQLHVIAALHAQRPALALAFEMFPRRVQPALDRWVRGELTEAEFLQASEWQTVWSFDHSLYMPIFHFARMHRLPMIAANVDRALTREVGQKGFDGVAEARREGVGRGAPPPARYVESLAASFAAHASAEQRARKPTLADAEFRRFVEAQTLWDRAMAEAIATAAKREPTPLVVGVMGRGHVEHGHGVAHQLRDLGIPDAMLLLPWPREDGCEEVTAGVADAVFGVAAPAAAAAPSRPRLGVSLEGGAEGVRIQRVEKGSIAEVAGIRDGDVVAEIAGRAVKQAGDVADAVRRQAPGTWLPLVIRRQGERIELVAKFPAGE